MTKRIDTVVAREPRRTTWKRTVRSFRGKRTVLLLSLLFFIVQTSYVLSGCQYTINGNPDVELVEVHVSPVSAVVPQRGSLVLSATVLGFSNTGTVTWSIEGANDGTIVPNGLTAVYTASVGLPTTVNIRITSDEDANRYVVCPVTIVIPTDTAFALSPDSVTLLTSNSISNNAQQFTLDTLTDQSPIPAIRWEVASGPGTIDPNGLYTPPASIDSDGVSATVRAVSTLDNTVFSQATVILRNASDSIRCFTRDILPLLSGSCGASGCHDAGGRGGFTALTYTGTVNGRNVLAGDARGSRLFQAIIDFNANTRMPPPPQPMLPPNQVLTIGQWINEGAIDCQ